MPNWVTNRIKFADVDSFHAFRQKYIKNVEGADGRIREVFDFNLLIPMPEALDIEEGSRTDDGIDIVLLRMRQQNVPGARQVMAAVECSKKRDLISLLFPRLGTDAEIEKKAANYEKNGKLDEVIELGKRAIQNVLDYGYTSWYKWSVANWGTKWNASNYRDDFGTIEVWFETAWSTPEPIIAKLVALMGPEAFRAIEYADEDIGNNCGSYILFDGAPAFAVPYERGSDDAMECAIRLNNAYDFYEKKDGRWVYKED